MINVDLLQEKLSHLPSNDSIPTLQHCEGDWSIDIRAERTDSIGCLLWELSAICKQNDSMQTEPFNPTECRENLQSWANSIATRATGLVEPLKVLEIDEEGKLALLRSQSPSLKGSDAHYYEVLLAEKEMATVTVKRFRANIEAGTKREQVPFALTHEVVAKLANAVCR
jgi:hypothetical protein